MQDGPLPAPGRIDVGRAVSEGWRAMLESFPLWLGVALLGLLLMLVSAVTVIGIFLLVPVLAWGSLAVLLAMFDGRGELRQLFSGFSDYPATLLTMWGVFLLGIAIALPGQAAAWAGEHSGNSSLQALGALLNLAWNLAMLPLSFAVYFAVDRRMGALEAFRASWDYTRGQWLNILLLVLAGIAIGLLGLLVLIIGIIPASAVIAFMWISAYRQLAGGATRQLPPAP
jgi:uncharacterized membrane protein